MVCSRQRVQRADGLSQVMSVVLPGEFGQGRPACRDEDPELFFPYPGQLDRITKAKAVCGRCPLRTSCLTYALRHNVEGVWGGTTEDERRARRRPASVRLEVA